MHLICVGISHRTAPVALRERLAMDAEGVEGALVELRERYPHAELAVLATCNRTEIYVARPLHGHPRIEQIIEWLAERHGSSVEELSPILYHLDNERVVRHLFRVACGFDSMVFGEHQIVGQVRASYDAAQRAETAGRAVHRIFQHALSTSKRIRDSAGFNDAQRSVAGAAVEFARHLFDGLTDKTVLAIGAGEMAKLTARHFRAIQPERLWITNRTTERAEALAAATGGEAVDYDQLDDHLIATDVVISSTGAATPILTHDKLKALMRRRRHRPLFLIDLAIPRDVEPAAGDLPNVYLFNLDDLQQAVRAGDSGNDRAMREAERTLEQSVGECYALIQTGDVNDLIRRLRRQLHKAGEAESQRTANKLQATGNDPEQVEQIVNEHTRRLINKILHKPVVELARGDSRTAALYATALRRLFDLDEEDHQPPERTSPAAQRRDVDGR